MEEKFCLKCEQSYPKTEEHWRLKSGKYLDCRKCHREREARRYAENPERGRAIARAYRARNPERAAKIWNSYYSKNRSKLISKPKEPLKQSARWKVRHEIKLGRIAKKPCYICNTEASEAHHPDYNFPLRIIWLCKKHHAWVHSNRLTVVDETLKEHLGSE
jgi:hypothetical protein